MAERRHLRLLSRDLVGKLARLELELVEDGPMGFRGGQFVILDTGLELDPPERGKHRKRAYSIVSGDREQRRFELLVFDVAGVGDARLGMGSEALCGRGPLAIELGAELSFSGPWGKLVADTLPHGERRLLLATDNGLSAALGFLRAAAFAPCLPTTDFLWLRSGSARYLSPGALRELLPSELGQFTALCCTGVGSSDRVDSAGRAMEEYLEPSRAANLASAWLVGDGDLVVPLGERLIAAGMAPDALRRTECFFHAPRS